MKIGGQPGSYTASLGAELVYQLRGASDKIGWAFRERGHAHSPIDFAALLDFMDRNIHGRLVHRKFQRPFFHTYQNFVPNRRVKKPKTSFKFERPLAITPIRLGVFKSPA